MAFIHLDVRCLYAILICTAFGSTLSSNSEIKVNPPEDFEIVDPGYLGYLYLRWQPPLFLDNCEEHTVEYELKYRSIDSENWRTIITKNLLYKDGFDLNKGVEAKIHTVLQGQCTNGSEVQSSWSEASYWTSPQGNPETKIQDMDCIYYNWQYLLCSWKLGMDANFDTNYYLFYWNLHNIFHTVCTNLQFHQQCIKVARGEQAWKMVKKVKGKKRYEGLDHALQCSDYIEDNGKNSGCRFPYLEEPDYKDFYICVNGSSKSQLIRPSYFIFQLQNIVKPLAPDYLNIIVKNSEDINLEWNIPKGPIPANCFIYEIKFTEDNTTWVATTFENEMYVTRTSNESQEICFLVRSKMNVYCTDDGIWSEWSEIECWRGVHQKEILTFLIPFAFILFLILLTTCMLMNKQKALQRMIFQKKQEVFSRQETLC